LPKILTSGQANYNSNSMTGNCGLKGRVLYKGFVYKKNFMPWMIFGIMPPALTRVFKKKSLKILPLLVLI
jgi:hypothetical protein